MLENRLCHAVAAGMFASAPTVHVFVQSSLCMQIRSWRERTAEVKATAEAQARGVMDKMVRAWLLDMYSY